MVAESLPPRRPIMQTDVPRETVAFPRFPPGWTPKLELPPVGSMARREASTSAKPSSKSSLSEI